ncbi:phosphatase and actin regulator 3 isoform X3 [Protopterus annectens]|uniref:phosphatase and actin regulator 3 isoform X3 n=1 Tax=Protopterus annectens TaxID=7888 RepID=UPI001CF931B8|nr:phosphatase and actin regulator 3 isoform X3 [Protopterus annectens]
MATSEEGAGAFLQRGRSQSDPNILVESGLDSGDSADEMDHSPVMHHEYLVSGIRTPPVRRNSKLATLGRIFKPWKWRKKKNEKLKQTSSVLEKKHAIRQGRDELIKKGLLEIMEQVRESFESSDTVEDISPLSEEGSQGPSISELKAFSQGPTERNTSLIPSPPLVPLMQCKAVYRISKATSGNEVDCCTARATSPLTLKSLVVTASSQVAGPMTLPHSSIARGPEFHGHVIRGQVPTPTGSPHLSGVHPPLPPSKVIEELHRALATKHRQESFHGRELRSSPKRRIEGRLTHANSSEHSKEKENAAHCDTEAENRHNAIHQSDENKENIIVENDIADFVLYQDEEILNSSIISGTLPRKCRKELLAIKLRNRPSKQELEDRNIFPQRTDEERQEIRQQIELKLSKRLSQRPAVEELERRNILKQRNDQLEQEERREIKQRLNRKLNQRPTVDELRDRKILIRFSDYVEVAKAQDYDRRADKPWTRLSAADKAAIRKELNEYKSNEMEVHASSKHLTRFHRP